MGWRRAGNGPEGQAAPVRTWLGRLGRWSSIAVLLVFALVGFLHLTRGTAVRQVRGVKGHGAPVAVGEPEFALAVTMLTGAALLPGHRVEVLLNGDGTYDRLWHDLRAATQSITLQSYYGGTGRIARTLSEILRERAAAGVRVLLLYDAIGTSAIPDEEVDSLREAGVQVEAFRPMRLSKLHLAQNRGHVRGIIVDNRIGWTGGFGIDDKWFGDGRTEDSWRETNVRFEGPAVRQLQAAFAASWVEATGVLLAGRPALAPADEGDTTAGLLYATPSLGSTQAERFLALTIAAARKTLYITNPYFAPDRNFVDLLAAAAERGVDVRILTAGPKTDVTVVRLAGRRWYAELLEAGVRVYEWQPTTLHAKTFVVDGAWSTIGSMNFDNRSMTLNDEATLMVLDRTVGEQMTRIFVDDLQHSEEITLEWFRKRPWAGRVAEWGASVMRRVL